MENRMIRLLIADDHDVFRSGLRILLSKFKHVTVVGEASNGQELVRRCAELVPDVVMTDLMMPVMDGIAATRELLRRKYGCRVIILSAYGREEAILQTLEAGALGYLLKTAESAEISEAISTVYHNKPYFCKEITERLTEIVSRNYQSPLRMPVCFTEREKEIIKLICSECTSKEIAYSLHLSKRTVEGHRTRIMDKIGARSIAGVITYAVEKGLNR
jgi:two-component system response regulator NreC